MVQLIQIFLVALLLVQPVVLREHTFVVTGRVVDNHGSPVAHARVVLEPSEQSRESKDAIVDEIIVHYETDGTGKFSIEQSTTLHTQNWVLYVISPLPTHVAMPITPPFKQLASIHPRFAGQAVAVRRKHEVNLGDIPVQVHYSLVSLRLLDHSGAPLFSDGTDDAELPRVWLRIRDSKGDVISEEGVARDAFRKQESSIALVLPEGAWHIEVANEATNMVWHPLAGRLIVRTSGTALNRTLQLTLGGWTAKESSPRAHNREASLKKLEQMGIDYSEEAFLERVKKSNISAVELFLSAEMSPNTKDRAGYTVLMTAVDRGVQAILETLISRGANVNSKTYEGLTALMIAAAGSNSAALKTLLQNNADVNAKDKDGMTPLMFAAANARADNVKILLAGGADVWAKDKDGKTAAMRAIESGHNEIAVLIRDARHR